MSGLLSARDTVMPETPANWATSCRVGLLLVDILASGAVFREAHYPYRRRMKHATVGAISIAKRTAGSPCRLDEGSCAAPGE
ncbi:hypothetical protein Pres01_46910 [Metapseudomonas resinovorans]|nr:hypothetical protein Pres01_46910 [Pseudomonas resinovorans]